MFKCGELTRDKDLQVHSRLTGVSRQRHMSNRTLITAIGTCQMRDPTLPPQSAPLHPSSPLSVPLHPSSLQLGSTLILTSLSQSLPPFPYNTHIHISHFPLPITLITLTFFSHSPPLLFSHIHTHISQFLFIFTSPFPTHTNIHLP